MTTKVLRCAIYCRKSSDEGLDQAFNSLDAQRAGGEAYILSRKEQGYVALAERYEDGGFSGGNMERPALKRLLADIDAGKIDVVVIYKIDRLTRSIRDFGRIMETLDARGVALMAVTQPIQTNDSMGRLMVHVLMSFAQFERELASERTRDKIALTRQRGAWTGGKPVLGYDVVNGGLVLNADEAPIVRAIFGLYLEHGSLSKVLAALAAKGIVNKKWTTKAGVARGGHVFVKSTLANLLGSPLYLGRVPHKGKTYPGVHPAIIEPSVFEAVQRMLAENGRSGASLTRNKHSGLLKSVLKCGCCDGSMVHTTTTTPKSVVHRYYTCTSAQVRGGKRCPGALVPAEQIEAFVIDKIKGRLANPSLATAVLDVARSKGEEEIRNLEARVALLRRDVAEWRALGTSKAHADAADAEHQAHALVAQVERVRQRLVSRGDVESGLGAFDPLWANLCPTERASLISLMVQRVVFDGKEGQVRITLRDLDLESKKGLVA